LLHLVQNTSLPFRVQNLRPRMAEKLAIDLRLAVFVPMGDVHQYQK